MEKIENAMDNEIDIETIGETQEEYIKQGIVLLGKRKFIPAIECFKKAEVMDPMQIAIYHHMGNAYAGLEEYEKAEQTIKKAILVDKENPLTYYHLGNVSLIKKDILKGAEYYNLAISKGYDHEKLYYNLGLAYEETGERQLAIRNYNKAISRNKVCATYYLRKANLYSRDKSYMEAVQTLEEMQLLCPDNLIGYRMLANIYSIQGEFNQANELLDKVSEQFPEQTSLVLDRIKICVMNRKCEQAIAYINQAQQDERFQEQIRELIFEKGKVYLVMKNIKEAIHYLEMLKNFETEDEKGFEARYLLINIYLTQENFEAVLEQAQVLMKQPEVNIYSMTAYYYKPLALAKLGRTKEAQEDFRIAIRYYRQHTLSQLGDMDAYLFRILCLKELKEYEKALELLAYVELLQQDSEEVRSMKVKITKLSKEDKSL